MQNPFLYEGRGRLMRAVAASTGNAPTGSTTIANGGYTETIAAHDCKELMFDLVFGAAATGTYVVQEVIDAGASVAGEEYETMTVTAERSSKWNAGEALTGFFRILNSSGQDATIYCQKKI